MTDSATSQGAGSAAPPAVKARLTMLAEMMDVDLAAAVRGLVELGIRDLDLKNHVFGRAIADLDELSRERLAALVTETRTSVYCFSSVLGHRNIDRVGEAAFRAEFEAGVANMVETARVVRPAKVRLLSCLFDERAAYPDATAYMDRHAPWVYAAYRDAVDHLAGAGLAATIENEPNTVLSNPAETLAFFERLERPAVGFTWDVQNMWQSGTYPTVEVYRALRPLIDYLHLKGGRTRDGMPGELAFRCPLDEASWPVAEIVGETLADGVSPVICLNPSHGAVADSYSLASLAGTPALTRTEALRDAAFLRSRFGEIA
jgi:sugar phosphate isomerase/epimerase